MFLKDLVFGVMDYGSRVMGHVTGHRSS